MPAAPISSPARIRAWHGPWFKLATALALLLALGLIAAAATGDLWLDEIWSVRLAGTAHSAFDVFTIRHDNSHPLNTLYLYFLGQDAGPFQYRMVSVLSGATCIGLVGYCARRRWGEREALLGIVLCAVCFPILLYASEARGYAVLMMLSLVAYIAWQRQMRDPGWMSLLAFWAACILGLLAQVTFVIALLAFGLGQLAADRDTASVTRRLLSLVRVHLVPALFSGWWYWFFLSRLELGGGNPSGGWPVVGQACALLLGLPDTPGFHVLAMAGVAAMVTTGVSRLRKAGDGEWLFFLTVILIGPAALLVLTYSRIFQVRYFVIAFPFFLLLSSHLFCLGWDRGGKGGRAVLLLALATFLAGNLQRDYFLLTQGRGRYSQALSDILRNSPTGPVFVGSDHDFRNGLVLQFEASRIPGGDRLRYVDEGHARNQPPDWFLVHSQDNAFLPPAQFQIRGVGVYQLAGRYGYAGLSGWNWFVYRRIG